LISGATPIPRVRPTLIQERLGWRPSITLEERLQNTCKWIFDQMSEGAPPVIR